MTDSTLEFRSLVEPVEFRGDDNGKRIVAAGVAMRYQAKSKPIGGRFREQFHAGAFTKTLQEQKVMSHNEHHGPYLASTGNGSLRTFDSPAELRYEIDLPDTSAGRDAAVLLERGDIRGSSIGFRAIPSRVKWSVDTDGMALRDVHEARLGLIDLTTNPAYDTSTADAALRSFADTNGIELRSVLEAVDAGNFAALLDPELREQLDEHGRETTVARRITHLYA